MPRDPNAPPPRPAYLSNAGLLEVYRQLAERADATSATKARYAHLLAKSRQGHGHTTGEPDSAPGARPDSRTDSPDGTGQDRAWPAYFRNLR